MPKQTLTFDAGEHPHPSVFIQEEMEERGWDRDELTNHMVGGSDRLDWGVTRLSLDFYFEVGTANPDLRIGTETEEALGRAFGVSAELFHNLEREWLDAIGAHTP